MNSTKRERIQRIAKNLKRLEVRSAEERDREGYLKQPQTGEELLPWENKATAKNRRNKKARG